MDLKTLKEELAELEKTPEAIELSRVARNTVRGESADSTAMIERMINPADEFKKAEDLTAMLDTSKRAGAGGTKAGLVGIRPNGGKAASQFLEDFTGTGRMKKQAAPFEEKMKFDGDKVKRDVKKPSVVLFKHCMDCMFEVRQDEAIPQMMPLPPGGIMNEIERAKWESVGIRPGEILCWLYCVPCMKAAMKEAQRLNSIGLTLIQNGQPVTAGQRFLNERGKRISENVITYIRRERNDPHSEVFYGECKERM